MRNRVLGWIILSFAATLFAAEPTKVVENGLKPQGQAMELKFTKELVFGADEAEDVYIWGLAGTSFDVDSKGNFYVSDVKNSQVHKFDSNGKFLDTIVKKGQGPGEAQFLVSYQIMADDSALMLEAGFGLPKITWFDAAGNPSPMQVPFTKPMPQTMWMDPSGQLVFSMWVELNQAAGTMTLKTGVLDRELNLKILLTEAERPMPTEESFSSPANAAKQIGGNIGSLMAESGVAAYDGQGHVYVAKTRSYEINKYRVDDLQTPLMTIKKEYKPEPMPEAEVDAIVDTVIESLSASPLAPLTQNPTFREKAKEEANAPATMNAISGLIGTEDGHLLVVRQAGFSFPSIKTEVFNSQGQFIGTAQWESYASGIGFASPMTFKNGKAYTLLRDENGDMRAARFSYQLVKK